MKEPVEICVVVVAYHFPVELELDEAVAGIVGELGIDDSQEDT